MFTWLYRQTCMNCSKPLLFTLIIPIILVFFWLQTSTDVFMVIFHTAKSDSCLVQPTQWQVNLTVFSQLYHLTTTWVSPAVFDKPIYLGWHCNQLLSLPQLISAYQQETWPPQSPFLPDQLLLNINFDLPLHWCVLLFVQLPILGLPLLCYVSKTFGNLRKAHQLYYP